MSTHPGRRHSDIGLKPGRCIPTADLFRHENRFPSAPGQFHVVTKFTMLGGWEMNP
jgi:hypothetical protein